MDDRVSTGGARTEVWASMVTTREATALDTVTRTKTKKWWDSHPEEAEDMVDVEGGEGEEGVVGTILVAVYLLTAKPCPQLRPSAPKRTSQRYLDRLGSQVGSRASGQLLLLRSWCSHRVERREVGLSR